MEFDPLKEESQDKKEQLTFLINFWYLTTYWKIKYESQGNSKVEDAHFIENCVFDRSWKVSSTNFIENPLYDML